MTAVLLGLVWAFVVGGWLSRYATAQAVRWHRWSAGSGTGPAEGSPSTEDGRRDGQAHRVAAGRPDGGSPDTGGQDDRRSGLVTVTGHIAEGIGRRVRGAVGRSADPAADRRWGLAVGASVVLLVVQPLLAFVPGVVAAVGPRLGERRRARRHEAAVVDELPDIVDLLQLTTAAGLPVGGAIGAIGGRPGGVVGEALVRAAALISRGGSTADALVALQAACGPPLRPLIDALADHDRYGTPLGPALGRVGVEGRLRRRRQAEEAARRLPITLLFPLVLTTLPAFVLLTVVPLLAGSLSSLHM